jgi:hypothetical protein
MYFREIAMHPDSKALFLTRRRWLAWAAGATAIGSTVSSRLYGFASDFWNKKAPAEWSQDEVHQLLTKSPWAKQVTAEAARSGGGGGGSRSTGGGNSGMGTGGMGGGTGRNSGMGGSGRNSGMGGTNNRTMGTAGDNASSSTKMPKAGQQYKGVVRWESAKPVLEAGKAALPDAFSNHYVISLAGFPIPGRRADAEDGGETKLSNAAAERIKTGSSLTAKGKDPVPADVVQVMGGALLLGFPQDKLKLGAEDKEVAFAAMLGRVAVKTKFTLKEMMYHESLAV